MKRFHGKPFNYFKLGKSFQEGREFMEHMKTSALALVDEAKRKNALVPVTACPVCGEKTPKFEITLHGFEHSRCRNEQCGHFFVSSLVPYDVRNDFFSKDKGYSAKNYCNPEVSEVRISEIAVPKMEFVEKFTAKDADSWLDVGCGSGEILYAAKKKGWKETVGLELSHGDIEFARKQYGIEIICQTLEEYAAKSSKLFDVISFFGVVQCLPVPGELVKTAVKLLKPGGIIAAELSHHDSVEYSALKTFPDHPTRASYNGATTLHHFSSASAEMMFRRAGLIPEAVWFYGTDIYEILNQWSFESPEFVDSPLYKNLLSYANELQEVLDKKEKSSGSIWIARKS